MPRDINGHNGVSKSVAEERCDARASAGREGENDFAALPQSIEEDA